MAHDEKRTSAWFRAVFGGDLTRVDRLLAEGAEPTVESDIEEKWYDAIERAWTRTAGTAPATAGPQPEPDVADRLQLGERVNALDLAILLGHRHIARRLIEVLGERAPSTGSLTRTPPLVLAAGRGDREVVELLLGVGARPDAGRDRSALEQAARNGQVEVLRVLLGAGARVDEPDEDGYTPLMWAAREGHRDAVHCLLEAGANAESWAQGDTPLLLAARGGHEEVCALLQPRVAEPLREQAAQELATARQQIRRFDALGEQLAETASGGSAEAITRLLAKGAPIDYVSPVYGYSPLMYASTYGHLAALEVLLEAGADPEVACSHLGKTALAFAVTARRFRLKAMRRLLAAGADPNARCTNGMTPLLLAIEQNYEDGVTTLLASGADPNLPDNLGRTPLRMAATRPKSMRDALVTAGAKP